MDVHLIVMVAALAVIWIAFQILTANQPVAFFSPRNLWDLAVQASIVGIVAGGMTLLIVARQVDVSVGSVLGFSAMMLALLQTPGPLGLGWPWWLALIAGLLGGTLIGALSGSFIAFFGAPSFVVTLAGLFFFRNAVLLMSSGRTVVLPDQGLQVLGSGSIGVIASWVVGLLAVAVMAYQAIRLRQHRQAQGLPARPAWLEAVLGGAIVLFVLAFVLAMNSSSDPQTGLPRGIPVPALIAASVLAILNWLAGATRFGQDVYAIGRDPISALLAGVNVKRVTVSLFALLGFLTALGAALRLARLTAATTDLGRDFELAVIAAALIGGAAFAGGRGTIIGALLGALLISSLQNGMVLMGVQTEWQNIVLAVALLLAILLQAIFGRGKP